MIDHDYIIFDWEMVEWVLISVHLYLGGGGGGVGWVFKNAYELLNLRALKNWTLYKKKSIFQCMDKIFCVEFQKKNHTKYLTHTLKDVHFIQRRKSKSS